MDKKRYNLTYYLVEGVHSIGAHGSMSFAALCMIMACLLIMGTFSLVAVNADEMLSALEQENQFIAYIDESYSTEQAQSLQSAVESAYNVSDVTFVTREEAMESFLDGRDSNELLESLPASVLRDRFEIGVVDIEYMEESVEQVDAITGIVNTSAAIEIAEGFVLVRDVATLMALVLVGMLLTISLFIIANTVRLATFYRRQEIAIMKMCGATDWFIRWPFVVEGMILGLGAALLAFLIQWGLYTACTDLLGQATTSLTASAGGFGLIAIVPFGEMALSIAGVFVGVGLLIGVVGSLVAIRRFLQV